MHRLEHRFSTTEHATTLALCGILLAACARTPESPTMNGGLVDGSAGTLGSGDGSSGTSAGDGAGALPGVRYVGRVDTSDPAGGRFAWSGSGLIARFSGTFLGVRLLGFHQYTVLIDGMLGPKLTSAGGLISSLATGLAAGPHTVELYRRTEANQGESQFLGFDLGSGELLAPPAPKDRRLEVIGDSISCGYGNEGADMNCHFTADTENHYLTYEAIAARALSADLVTVAWSGKGVVCNYGDDATSCVDPLPVFYDRTLPASTNSAWSFAAWQPQAVVINLGTNDFSTAVDPTEADFEMGYVTFLSHIRSKYADAIILCTVAPLLGGADLATAKAYIAKAVQQRNDGGDAKVKTFDMAPADPADGYGCDYHPSLKTHQKMATQLQAVLHTELGW